MPLHVEGRSISPAELPGIDEKVAFLRQPDSYPGFAVSRVETLETHMAWVFLTERHAWKMKKAVRTEFLDFSTLEQRRIDCLREVKLNRRLAPNVYESVVPLLMGEDGRLRLGGKEGRPVDWLVKMRRLPAQRMLSEVLAANGCREEEARAVGDLLGRFYRRAHRVVITPKEYRERLERTVRANRMELCRLEFDMPRMSVEAAADALLEFIFQRAELLDQRVCDGHIVDGHGDLRPEHVGLLDPPIIIDCAEFNREFRIQDAAADLSFLILECRRLGAHEAGDWIWAGYCDVSGDDCPGDLARFHRRYHALTRAKIALWHLDDSRISGPDSWKEKARRYLDLAASPEC